MAQRRSDGESVLPFQYVTGVLCCSLTCLATERNSRTCLPTSCEMLNRKLSGTTAPAAASTCVTAARLQALPSCVQYRQSMLADAVRVHPAQVAERAPACWLMPSACILLRWLSVRLETLGALAAFAAAVLTVEQRGAASTFGLVLSYALTITQLTSITVRRHFRVLGFCGPATLGACTRPCVHAPAHACMRGCSGPSGGCFVVSGSHQVPLAALVREAASNAAVHSMVPPS